MGTIPSNDPGTPPLPLLWDYSHADAEVTGEPLLWLRCCVSPSLPFSRVALSAECAVKINTYRGVGKLR